MRRLLNYSKRRSAETATATAEKVEKTGETLHRVELYPSIVEYREISPIFVQIFGGNEGGTNKLYSHLNPQLNFPIFKPFHFYSDLAQVSISPKGKCYKNIF